MPFNRCFLSRRGLLSFVAIAALPFGLAMLHPYPRQSLFGPTIRGKPQCVWEDAVRWQCGERSESWFDGFNHWLGGVEDSALRLDNMFDHPDMVPVVVALLEDHDPKVRSACLSAIIDFPSLRDRAALPALRKCYADDEAQLRLTAGHAIFRIEKDAEVLHWFVELLEHTDPEMRVMAMSHLGRLSDVAPELYPHIVARAKDADKAMRCEVLNAMLHFRKKAAPILIDGLNDADPGVRYRAVLIAEQLGPDAKDAFSALEACMRDLDPAVRHAVHSAMPSIDPMRFNELNAGTR